MTEGVDLYTKFQSVSDWGAVRRAGKTWAYFKGTDGVTTRDTGNWPAQARAAGIACGLYGYAQPGSAVDQYNLLLSTAQARGAMDLSPALDLEDPFVPGNAAAQFAIAWLSRAAAVGQIPVFYANDSMMSYLLATVRNAVPSVWPWIARYGSPPKNTYRTWQFSSTRQVPGITASGVDEDTGEAPIIAGGGGGSPTPASGEDEDMERVDCKAIDKGGYAELHPGGTDQARITVYPGPNGVWFENGFFWTNGHTPGKSDGGIGYNPADQHGGQPFFIGSITTFSCPRALLAGIAYSAASDFYMIARG